jgi:hypothetical protein
MVVPPEFNVNAALGIIPGAQIFFARGFNDFIPSTTFMILSNVTSAAFISPFPPTSQQLQVVSASANDTAAGTGAQQVTIDYLTDPSSVHKFTRFSEIVNMNGLGAVTTLATDISRIEKFRISRVGTSGTAAGNISLQSVGGATTFERITAGENISRTAVHFVPNGYQSIVTGFSAGCSTSGGVRFVLTKVEEDPVGNLVRIGQKEISVASGATSATLRTPIYMTNPNNKRLSFAIAARGLAANQEGTGTFVSIDLRL